MKISAVCFDNFGPNLYFCNKCDFMRRLSPYLLFLLWTAATVCHAAPSVLSSGDWVRFAVVEEGIYRITYQEIADLGLVPETVALYGTTGEALQETPGPAEGETLREIPVWAETGADGVFGPGDYILFYGQGPMNRTFTESAGYGHSLHPYDTRNCYYLTSRAGGRRITVRENTLQPSVEVDHYDDFAVHESELTNFLGSGRQWYGEQLSLGRPSQTVSFSLPNADTEWPVQVFCQTVSRNTGTAYLTVSGGGAETPAQRLPVIDLSETGGNYAAPFSCILPGAHADAEGKLDVTLRMTAGSGMSYVWIDHIRLLARSHLRIGNNPLFFRDYYSTGPGSIARFHLSGGTAGTRVWDITDPHDVFALQVLPAAGEATFTADASELREYVAFRTDQPLLSPVWLPADEAAVENQDLNNLPDADLIIVTPPAFSAQAGQLAELHRIHDGMSVVTVTDAQIYHAFSGGKTDPAAIRNFLKFKYEQSESHRLKYALLMGDGTYDHRAVSAAAKDERYLVTYQSENSLSSVSSFTSDDYFGIFGEDASPITGHMDIGVGRLPVKSAEEAAAVVAKIERYLTEPQWGAWHRTLCFMADDEDGNSHLLQTEDMTSFLAGNHPEFDIQKLYLDAYRQETTLNGHRYPEVQNALKQSLANGILIFNYVGHGNETGLTNERVINETDIATWRNTVYPLFITASCEFGRYDNHMLVTAAEKLLLMPEGGAIGLLSATRLVYSELNSQLNAAFYRYAFAADGTGRLGDILRQAKNASQLGINARAFALLGDPALRLAAPHGRAVLTDINGQSPEEASLQAFQTVNLSGEIQKADGTADIGFNGTADIVLYDKPATRHTLDNDGEGGTVAFQTSPVLFKGACSVSQGHFSLTFTLPGDLDYTPGQGRVVCYAWNGTTDAAGQTAVTVGGSAAPPASDHDGPEIRMFLNDTLFRAGGLANEQPVVLALLRDESGINVSENAFGHPLELQLQAPDGTTSVWQVNAWYQSATDDATTGQLTYRLPTLTPGLYTLQMEAWDICNNRTTASLPFQVVRSHAVAVRNLRNYPNPFSDKTRFYFEHNQPDAPIEAVIRIYALDGTLLRVLQEELPAGGYTAGNLTWDGRTASGKKIGTGIYLYRLSLRFKDGQTVTESAKLIVQ